MFTLSMTDDEYVRAYGLLRGAFRPADEVCVFRSLARQRCMLLRHQAKHIPDVAALYESIT